MVLFSYTRWPITFLCKSKKYIFLVKHLTFSYVKPINSFTFVSNERSIVFSYSYTVLGMSARRHYSTGIRKQLSQTDIITEEIKSRISFDEDTFNQIKGRVLSVRGNIDEHNFDSVFIGICTRENLFNVGRTFFHFIYAQSKCNLASVGTFFRLCYECESQCTNYDKEFLINVAHNILDKYPVLDYRTCENLALGLSVTCEWRTGLKLLEMCKVSATPSNKMYSVITETSFWNKDFNVGWKLMHEMAEYNRLINVNIYKALMESLSSEEYYNILKFLEKYDIHPSEALADFLLEISHKIKEPLSHSSLTTIHSSGTCKACNNKLKAVNISEVEFQRLRTAFLNSVLIGKSVFLKTKPQEFESFQGFLKRSGHLDVVLDGLNIAYAKDHRKLNKLEAAQLLCDVVKHFVNLGKKVAVLGRKHMETWPSSKMNYVTRKANLFLAENVSADDPYLLYAAMNSGLGTHFVSRDQMRGHKFLLKDSELMSIFSRWQQKYQLYFQYVTPQGLVKFAEPPPYLLSVQEVPGHVWHLPISSPMEGVPAHLVHVKTKWLCIS